MASAPLQATTQLGFPRLLLLFPKWGGSSGEGSPPVIAGDAGSAGPRRFLALFIVVSVHVGLFRFPFQDLPKFIGSNAAKKGRGFVGELDHPLQLKQKGGGGNQKGLPLHLDFCHTAWRVNCFKGKTILNN